MIFCFFFSSFSSLNVASLKSLENFDSNSWILNSKSKLTRGVEGKIDVDLTHKSNQLLVCISDNGGGFLEELIDRITEPYITTRENGTGLGLSIVTKIMEDHNGEILLQNKTNGGAEVTLVFNKSNWYWKLKKV